MESYGVHFIEEEVSSHILFNSPLDQDGTMKESTLSSTWMDQINFAQIQFIAFWAHSPCFKVILIFPRINLNLKNVA